MRKFTTAFDLYNTNENKLVENPYSDVDVNAWYWNYIQCTNIYIPIYPLPVEYETNIPYVKNQEQNKNGFLPDTAAICMHVAEALVEIKKEKDKIIVELPEIQEIQKELEVTFKDTDYTNLYPMHGKVPKNIQRIHGLQMSLV